MAQQFITKLWNLTTAPQKKRFINCFSPIISYFAKKDKVSAELFFSIVFFYFFITVLTHIFSKNRSAQSVFTGFLACLMFHMKLVRPTECFTWNIQNLCTHRVNLSSANLGFNEISLNKLILSCLRSQCFIWNIGFGDRINDQKLFHTIYSTIWRNQTAIKENF